MDEFLKQGANFLKDIGPLAAILALWLKYLYDKRVKKTEEAQKKLEEQAREALKEKHSAIDFTTEFHLRVINAENIMMRAFGPCRMFVYHFYNGEFSLAKLSLLKICIRHEIVEGPYVPYMKEHYEGKPVPEMFSQMFKDVFDHGFAYLETKDEIKDENRPLYNFMKMWDIGSMLFLALKDHGNNPTAIIVMHWPRIKHRNDDMILQARKDKNSIENIYREL